MPKSKINNENSVYNALTVLCVKRKEKLNIYAPAQIRLLCGKEINE